MCRGEKLQKGMKPFEYVYIDTQPCIAYLVELTHDSIV